MIHVLVLLVIRTVLVYRIVSEMSVFGFQILQIIGFGCKPNQSFFISIYFQWIYACDYHIYPNIEFQSIYQKRVTDILTYYKFLTLLFRYQILEIVNQKYPFALR